MSPGPLVREEEARRSPERYFDGYPDMRYDDQTAYVHPADLDRMPEYSASVPTGVCDGKLWKCKVEHGWMLGSYEAAPDSDDEIVQRFRHLIVLDSMEIHAVTDDEIARAEKLRVIGCRFLPPMKEPLPSDPEWYGWREITLRPLLFGNYQLCIGPRDDDFGFDESFMYDDFEEALKGLNSWNPDFDRGGPPGRWTRDDNAHHGRRDTEEAERMRRIRDGMVEP